MQEKAEFMIVDGRNKSLADAKKKKYIVMYNPTEITVSAGVPMKKAKPDKLYKIGTDKKHKPAQYSIEEHNMRVTVPLSFDKTEEYSRGEVSVSVQTEVEGFIAMLENANTRHFIFSWGSLCYEGKLMSLSGQYTMFTKEGTPIRATVSLTMQCEILENNNVWIGKYLAAYSGASQNKKEKAILKIAKAKCDGKEKVMKRVENQFYTMEVQYNPSSISISSGVADEENVDMSISFQLIFDATESRQNEPDIERITNGLLSLMTDKNLTEMEFRWGEMQFKGQLTGMQAQFTMFSEEGIPMRSLVDISLTRDNMEDTYRNDAFNKFVQ